MKELTLHATIENLNNVLDFVNTELEKNDCPPKVCMQVEIAVEEIFVNIAHYAYNPETGHATVRCEVDSEASTVIIEFLDSGAPYNPLVKADPDTTLSAEERGIGGLGIFMVKKSMDSVEYEYKNGKNILTIKKGV